MWYIFLFTLSLSIVVREGLHFHHVLHRLEDAYTFSVASTVVSQPPMACIESDNFGKELGVNEKSCLQLNITVAPHTLSI